MADIEGDNTPIQNAIMTFEDQSVKTDITGYAYNIPNVVSYTVNAGDTFEPYSSSIGDAKKM